MQHYRDCTLSVGEAQTGTVIDGFGVNLNTKEWKGGRLRPVLHLLTDDLRASLFRTDLYGMSDWIDPDGTLGRERALSPAHLEEVYTSPVFADGFALLRELNEKGIRPYITCSGGVPSWMYADDGKTLGDDEAFCDMLLSYIFYAKKTAGIDFTLFGPINETDLGLPEGPSVTPEHYVSVCERLDEKLRQHGLSDIRLVVPEQALFNPDFVTAFAKRPALRERVAAFSMHTYGDLTDERYAGVTGAVRDTAYADTPFWLSEYGDLDQTGEKEWYIAWKSTERVLHAVENGFTGAMQWDAYDNYHDHDGAFTIYGLIRYARFVATPKKRYYAAKQLYRFVRPGDRRLSLSEKDPSLRAVAFTDGNGGVTVFGMNTTAETQLVQLRIPRTVFDGTVLDYYRTTETENCVRVGLVPFYSRMDAALTDTGELLLPPHCIFTVTNRH